MKKKALIIGGAGFIGHHLANYLAYKNYKIGILDNLSNGDKNNISKKNTFYFEDIVHGKSLNKIIQKYDSIFHLAAKIEVQSSMNNPTKTFENNILGTSRVVESCVKFKKKLLFASSCAIYPLDSKNKFKEESKTVPNSPYSISKKIGEDMINFYLERKKINAIILRCFNAYGLRQKSNSQYAAVVPKFISNAKKNGYLKLNNGGNQSRDFVYIEDICKAYYILNKLKKVGTFNIGSGVTTKIKDLAKIIIEIIGKGKSMKGKKNKGDANYSCADIKKIKKIGFGNTIKIKEGLKKII